MRRALTIVLVAGLGVGLLAAQSPDSREKSAILNSKHDFRAASKATIRSTSGQDACVFCHTPHNVKDEDGYLFNQKKSTTPWAGYSSSTMHATVTPVQPHDVSKLCLSCHDGTIALGDTVNDGLISFLQGNGYRLPASSASNVGHIRGLTDDHPMAFEPVANQQIHVPPGGDPVQLDHKGRLQCTSCHEPHQQNLDPTTGKFLVKSNEGSAICLSCHAMTGWMNSAHRFPSDKTDDLHYTALEGAHTGYVGVSKNACESCHRPHSPQEAQRLVKFPQEKTCYQCHNGSVAHTDRNIQAEFQSKIYKHPVDFSQPGHDASESPTSARWPLPETSVGAPRHAQCVDCHNPHFSTGVASQAPMVSGALAGASGYSGARAFLPQATREYEICFKCHSDSANKPQMTDTSTVGIGFGRNPQRQFDIGSPNRYNTRVEFEFSASFHPVTRPSMLSAGPGGDVPSLRAQPVAPGGAPLAMRTLSPSSYIYCTDCHNSDSGRNLGQLTGPAGPHGSNLPHLLERASQMEMPPAMPGAVGAGASYSPSNYALCDKCHDVEGSVLLDQSFREHSKHVRSGGAACSTCHAPHASNAPMLINFDRSIVAPSSSGRLEYRHGGLGQDTCFLTCHGVDHNPKHSGLGRN